MQRKWKCEQDKTVPFCSSGNAAVRTYKTKAKRVQWSQGCVKEKEFTAKHT